MRSNKRFAQYGVDQLRRHLDGDNCRRIDQPFNVRVDSSFDPIGDVNHLTVSLFGNPVMQVVVEAKTRHPISIIVFSGFHYDSNGNPSNKTKELLNSLLDCLGDEEIIPQNVRVRPIEEHGKVLFYLSQKDTDNMCILNENYCNLVRINPNKHLLDIEQTDLSGSESTQNIRLMVVPEN